VLLADKLGVNLAVKGKEEDKETQPQRQNELELLLDSIQEEQDWKVDSC
jgi:hypothetical protein